MRPADLRVDPHVARGLGDEEILAAVAIDQVLVAFSSSRLLIADPQRLRLDLPVSELHRVQLVVENDRPGLVTLVPMKDRYPAELVLVPKERLEEAGEVVMAIGREVAAR